MNSIAMQPNLALEFDLPWVTKRLDRKRFIAILSALLAVTLVFGGVIPLIELPVQERSELEELPPALARIQLKKPEVKIPPPPPPPKVEEKVEPKVEKETPVESPPKPVEKKIEPKVPTVSDAREKAKVSGLLAFQDAFADMREAIDVSSLTDTASIQQGAGESATIDRSLLTAKTGKRSAGVNVAALSKETGGVALSGRETTRVEAPEGARGTGREKKPKVAKNDGLARERSIEEVRRVFDSNKGAIFAIYNRALRKNPGLQGKVVLELTISPSGQVLDCKVLESELTDDAVVAKIVNRVKLFNFGAQNVRKTRINYPVHFLPS